MPASLRPPKDFANPVLNASRNGVRGSAPRIRWWFAHCKTASNASNGRESRLLPRRDSALREERVTPYLATLEPTRSPIGSGAGTPGAAEMVWTACDNGPMLMAVPIPEWMPVPEGGAASATELPKRRKPPITLTAAAGMRRARTERGGKYFIASFAPAGQPQLGPSVASVADCYPHGHPAYTDGRDPFPTPRRSTRPNPTGTAIFLPTTRNLRRRARVPRS